jgi:hypothetical protein
MRRKKKSPKHSNNRSSFEAPTEMNATVQADLKLDKRAGRKFIFNFRILLVVMQ